MTLIITKDETGCRGLIEALNALGRPAAVVRGIEDARLLLGPQRPSQVLLDADTLDADALEICRVLRSGEGERAPCLVAFTGQPESDEMRRVLDSGVDDLICIPLAPPALEARLQIAVRNAQALAESRRQVGMLQEERAERRRLQGEIVGVIARERRRLGQELHDGLCQHLAAAILRARSLARRLAPDNPPAASELGDLGALLEEAMADAHDVAAGLCPVGLDSEGLDPALRALAGSVKRTHKLDCRFQRHGPAPMLDPDVAFHLLRIAQEAVNNAVKHAQASRITVSLSQGRDGVCLRVRDDGRGVPPDCTPRMGMRLMSLRAQALGGILTVGRAGEVGTIVTCSLPRGKERQGGGADGS